MAKGEMSDLTANELVKSIKKLVLSTIGSVESADFKIGTVTSIEPMEIRISEKIKIGTNCLYFLRSAYGNFELRGECGGKSISGVARHNLVKGSIVALAKVPSANKYIVLGEVYSI